MAFTITTDIFNDSGDGSTQNNAGTTNTTGSISGAATVYGSDSGLVLTGTGGWTITVNGGVFGATYFGIDLQQTSTTFLSTITVGTTGDVFGQTNAIRTSHATSVTNNASIGSVDGSAIVQSLAGSTKSFTISNAAAGSIVSEGGFGVELSGSASGTVTRTINNLGFIFGTSGAINTDADGLTTANDKVDNKGKLGHVDEFGSGTVSLGLGNDTLTNSGFIYGGVYLGNGNNVVTNTKTIAGWIEGGEGNDTVTNTAGTIGDDIYLGDGTNVLNNTGTISNDASSGAYSGGSGNDTVKNSGIIDGAVYLGDGTNFVENKKSITGTAGIVGGSGNDTVTNTAGTIAGNFTAGDGHNALTNTGTIGDGGWVFEGGSGNDTVKNSGTLNGDVILGDGTNLVENSKSITGGIFGGEGNDTVTVNGGTVGGNIYLGDGTNTVTTTGTIGTGDDIAIDGGADNDTVTVNGGTIHGGVYLYDGNNKFAGTGGKVLGNVVLGSGDDIYDAGATVSGLVFLGTGANKFTNKGKIEGFNDDGFSVLNELSPTDPSDKITDSYTFINSGTIRGGIQLLADAGTTNTFTNSGTIGVDGDEVAIVLSDAIDIVNNSGTVHGVFFLGGGADVFTGGANNDAVASSEGADTINLGADKFNPTVDPWASGDVYFAGGAALMAADGNDTIDGGVGAGDAYVAASLDENGDLVATTDSVFINLDTLAQTDTNFIWSTKTSIAANTAYGLDVSGSADSTVKDTIKGFEWAAGGNGNDVIFGTAAANTLFGDNPDNDEGDGGSDVLYGGAGSDTIVGGGGDDFIVGGAGKDVLYGGNLDGGDIGTDFFTYGATTESTAGVAGRDVIMDFDLGSDVLDLSKLGSNLKFIGNNVAFGTTAGQIRTVFTSKGTIVQLDTNGDKVVDFAVELRGRHNLSAGNFILGGTIGDAGDNTFTGGETSESYFGAGGEDTISGGGGNDTLLGGADDDTIDGGAGNDTLSGGSDNDTLLGQGGDDILIGGAGDDILEGGSTDETNGDTAAYAQTFKLGGYTVTDNEDGTLEVDATNSGEGIDTLAGIERLSFGSETYAVQLGNAGNELFEGTDGRDMIFGGAGNDSINANSKGNDIFIGGSGTDTLDFSTATVSVTVNLDNNTASSSQSGSDAVYEIENVTGGSGADVITGSADDNVLIGGNGADTLNGLEGGDTITGGAGSDKINLGTDSDADRVIFSAAGDFGDTVTGFGVGEDTVAFSGALNTAYDDVGADDDVFAFMTGNGSNGVGGETAVDFAVHEAVLLGGTGDEGVNNNQLSSAIAVANELNNEFSFSGTGDLLVVVNSLDSNSFALWQYTEASAGSGVATTDLTLIGVFTADGKATESNFELIV